MRYTILFITFLMAAGLAMGCTPTEGKTAERPIQGETAAMQHEATAMQRENVKTETKEAAQAIEDYSYARKAEFVTGTKRELADIQVELDKLSARVDRSTGEAKAEAKVRLDAVRGNWAKAKNQLDQAERATEATWNDVKRGFEQSRTDLKDSFDKTRQWLSDKIEP